MNFMLYDDSHKDPDGFWYLSKFDSFHYYYESQDMSRFNILGFLGSALLGMGNSTLLLFYLPVVLTSLSSMIFYFLLRKYFNMILSVCLSLFVFLHPVMFSATVKGYYDTNFMIFFLGLLILWGMYQQNWYLLGIGLIMLYLTWDGYVLWFVLVFSWLMIENIFIKKKYNYLYLLPVVAYFGYVGFGYATWFSGMREIGELQSYSFYVVADFILLIICWIYLIYKAFKLDKCSRDKTLTIYLFIILFILGISMQRFFYIFLPVYAIMLGFILQPVFKHTFRLMPIFMFAGILFSFGLSYDYNVKTIFMEDSVYAAINDTNDKCVLADWDMGHFIIAYGGNPIYRGSPPENNKFYGVLNGSVNETKCYVWVTSRDAKYNLSLPNWYILNDFYEGDYINVTTYLFNHNI